MDSIIGEIPPVFFSEASKDSGFVEDYLADSFVLSINLQCRYMRESIPSPSMWHEHAPRRCVRRLPSGRHHRMHPQRISSGRFFVYVRGTQNKNRRGLPQ